MKKALLGLTVAALVAISATACTPPPAAGSIRCAGGSGYLDVSPAVNPEPQPITYTLDGSSSAADCVDRTGTGITSARIDSLAVTFGELSCFVVVGTTGTGPAVIRWSDGTTSNATTTATLDAAYSGTLELALTSGHFAGSTGTAPFLATPEQGDCFNGGITRESITVGSFALIRP